jgi:phage gp36-like protein
MAQVQMDQGDRQVIEKMLTEAREKIDAYFTGERDVEGLEQVVGNLVELVEEASLMVWESQQEVDDVK